MGLDRRAFVCSGLSALAVGRSASAELRSALSHAGNRARRPLVVLAPEGCGDNLAPVIARFEALSGARVRVRSVGVDNLISSVLLSSISGDGAFDVALPPTFGIPDLAEAGMIRPLDDMVARLEPEGFRDSWLYRHGHTFDGQFYGYQTDGDVYLTFFNRTMSERPEAQSAYADRHGVPLVVPQTWAEFDRQVAFFHDPERGSYGGSLFRNTTYLGWEWWCRLHAGGIWPFGPDMTPQIAGEEGVLALEDMIRSGSHLVDGSNGLVENWKRYARGDVYANIGWGGTQKYLAGAQGGMRGQIAHGLMPGMMHNGRPSPIPYFNWGWTYVVSSRSDMAELAYLLSVLATSPEVSTQAVRAQGGFFDPFREEHYTDPEIRAIYSDEFLSLHREAMSAAIPDLYVARRSSYMNALSVWLARAIDGSVDPQFALERVAQEWEFITERAGRAIQSERWMTLRDGHPQSIRGALRDLRA